MLRHDVLHCCAEPAPIFATLLRLVCQHLFLGNERTAGCTKALRSLFCLSHQPFNFFPPPPHEHAHGLRTPKKQQRASSSSSSSKQATHSLTHSLTAGLVLTPPITKIHAPKKSRHRACGWVVCVCVCADEEQPKHSLAHSLTHSREERERRK